MDAELESGGNIRFEDRASCDSAPWFASCADLVTSRNDGSRDAIKGGAYTPIEVIGVTRVHNRGLRHRFEERVAAAAQSGHGEVDAAALEYLFLADTHENMNDSEDKNGASFCVQGLLGRLGELAVEGFSSDNEKGSSFESKDYVHQNNGEVSNCRAVILANRLSLLNWTKDGNIRTGTTEKQRLKKSNSSGIVKSLLVAKVYLGPSPRYEGTWRVAIIMMVLLKLEEVSELALSGFSIHCQKMLSTVPFRLYDCGVSIMTPPPPPPQPLIMFEYPKQL